MANSGTALVLGSAPSLFADKDIALKHRPDAVLIAVNDVARIVYCQHLVSLHAERMGRFRAHSLNPNIITHTGATKRDGCDVDHWHHPIGHSGATSAYSAAEIARDALGFHEVILAGCPMDGGGGYVKGVPLKTGDNIFSRIGHARKGHMGINAHKRHLKNYAQAGKTKGIYSMSGYSAQILGKPDFMRSNDANV